MSWSDFNRRANAWAINHPWRYAAWLGLFTFALWFGLHYFGNRAAGRPASLRAALGIALINGILWFLAWGLLVPRMRARRGLKPFPEKNEKQD
jgi:hypothetical protein